MASAAASEASEPLKHDGAKLCSVCRVVLKEQGDEHLGQRSSDVALVVREELHPQFERKGNDLLTRVEVPLVQALTCEYVEVPLLDGDSMEVCPVFML